MTEAMLLHTEKGRNSAIIAKAKEKQMSAKEIRECQQLLAWAEFTQRVFECFGQKASPTIPIALQIIKYTYRRNNQFIHGERTIPVLDSDGKFSKL